MNKKRFNADERDGADITQLTSSSKHSWANKWETDFLVSFLRGRSELDGFTDDNSYDESRGDQYLLQQQTHHELNNSSTVSLRNGVSRHQRELQTIAVGENSFAGDLIQNEFLYNYETGKFKLLGGLAHENEKLNQSGSDRSAELVSTFVQSSIKEGPVAFQAGMRLDKHALFGSYLTGSTGLSYHASEDKFALQFSQGFKSPSLYQLYADPLTGIPIGNKDLKPEKNNALEARWERDIFELALFRNALSNIITYVNGQGYRNQERFVTQGLEVGADLKKNEFRLRPSFTMQEFKYEDSPVLRRPTRSLGLDATWFPEENLELYSRLKAFNERSDIDENGDVVKLNGFETITLGSKYFFQKSEVGIQVLNITNREYEEVHGYSVMPRSVFLHYAVVL